MRANEFTQKLFESKLSYIGNCTDDDVIEHLFGDATGFAQAVEEYGDDFELDDLVVKYDPESDIHSFYYKQQGVTEGFDKEAGAWRDWQIKMLPRKIEMLSRLVKGWVPSKANHIAAIEAGYNAMKETGDVKDAAKAIADTLKEIQRRQGVTEDTNNILDADYYMKEGCGIYAVALALNEPGSQIYIISNKNGESWSKSFPYEITHVFVNLPGQGQYDVRGKRSPEVMATDFNLSKGDYSIKGPFDPKEFFRKFMGSSDAKPLYGTIKDVKQIKAQIKDTLDEMALSTYKTMGDFSKPGPFTGADKKLVPHPKNIEKATRFFEQTPFDFRLFFSHLKGTGKYSEHGPMSPDQIKQVFGQDAEEIINGSEDAITVVYVGNKGDSKVMLTPWMMAHRFGHAINAGARNKNWTAWGEAENYFFQTVNNLLDEHYGKVPATKPPGRNMLFQLTPEYNALFNAMGTQRSSTSGQIRRPYEFLYELFAQYLGTGKVTLNPLPTNLGYGRRVFGNPTKYMNIKPEYRDEGERKQAADSLAYTMELLFNDVLSDSVGKIFVM